MEKVTIGRSRSNNYKPQTNKKVEADLIFKIGCAAVCMSFIVSFFGGGQTNSTDVAIPVMSTAFETEQTDEMTKPEMDTSSSAEEWSFYDYIGQMIADLLFGES